MSDVKRSKDNENQEAPKGLQVNDDGTQKNVHDVGTHVPKSDENPTNRGSEPPKKSDIANEDDELEEGELKDDDDDDEDDDDDDDQDDKTGDKDNGIEKQKTRVEESDDAKSSSSSEDIKIEKPESPVKKEPSSRSSSPSSLSSSSSVSKINTDSRLSLSSRHSSRNRHSSPRSHQTGSSIRALSPISSQQARLVSMRAKLLEARSREIEQKFQRKSQSRPLKSTSPAPSNLSKLTLKTTVAKPPITYCENPDPGNYEPSTYSRKKAKRSKSSKRDTKEKSSKKSKKRKKKSSSTSKRRKKSRSSDTPKKSASGNVKRDKTVSLSIDSPFEVQDRIGPRTPPDNHVLTIEDEQIEWPSYLIRMTTTQPSISYSVNPDSVAETDTSNRYSTADLNADYEWYYEYFSKALDMDKVQAQLQACFVILSSGSYEDGFLDHWLEQKGLSRQSVNPENKQIFPSLPSDELKGSENQESPISNLRDKNPKSTTLKLLRELVLPNGKVLPPGTIQKVVHPYPRSERSAPDLNSPYSNLF